ncbi:UNVERIFIED_CONTAM: hypothetical protein Sradi_3585700 [Sesamum radiatum]|uniref:DUF659 domain-containing protein n=1 Tax=Sesamum radiatum TaxID=300843 RepID=A0AAW2QH01_SESRA
MNKFIGSVDASSYSHTGEKLFELLDKFGQQIGEKNVIQVITCSASANVLADLMSEDFLKILNLKKTYEQAMMINGYIYNRSPLLDMLRDFIAKRDMVRPPKTRFATAFFTLKRFHSEKPNLKKMFTSKKWIKSKYAKEAQCKLVASTILKTSFWNNVIYILKVAGPFVKVFQLVNGGKKPPMGCIYESKDRAKKAIAASFPNVEEKYKKKKY